MSIVLERSKANSAERSATQAAAEEKGEPDPSGEPRKSGDNAIRDPRIWEKLTGGAITAESLAAAGLV